MCSAHAHSRCDVVSSCSWHVFLTLTDCVLSSATHQTKPLSFAFLSGILLQPWVNNTYPTSKVSQPFTEGTLPLPFLEPLDLGTGSGQEKHVNYMRPQCKSIFDYQQESKRTFPGELKKQCALWVRPRMQLQLKCPRSFPEKLLNCSHEDRVAQFATHWMQVFDTQVHWGNCKGLSFLFINKIPFTYSLTISYI